MYRFVIFDLDGTILDTLGDLADALNHTLGVFSLPLKTEQETRAMVGRGLRNLVIDAAGDAGAGRTDEILAELVSYYSVHSMDRTAPYKGIPELLAELRSRGVTLAVLSNKKDEVTASLCSHFFPGLFDIARGERSGIPIKPSPEAVFSVIEESGFSPEETLYVGDSEVDIATAGNAGIDSVIVTWGFRDRDQLESAGAGRIADTIPELLDMITS